MAPAKLKIRPATAADAPVIVAFIKKLAEYERLSREVEATEDLLRETLFGPRRSAEAAIGYFEQRPAGFVVFFQNYSTFLGRPGITSKISLSMRRFADAVSAGRSCVTWRASHARENAAGSSGRCWIGTSRRFGSIGSSAPCR